MVLGNLKMPLDKIRAVLDAAAVGVYRIILTSGCKPRMEASAKMLELLGLERNCNLSEEEVYEYWFSRGLFGFDRFGKIYDETDKCRGTA